MLAQLARPAPLAAVAIIVFLPFLASAADEAPHSEPQVPTVWGGEPVDTCGWPTTVAVTSGGGLCSGTLIHPEIVMYAAHCGAGNKTITFGETTGGGTSMGTSECMTNPDYNMQGTDWAWCRLSQPVNLPVTPIGLGCELDQYLKEGGPVALVGFGMSESSGAGRKRWGMSTMNDIRMNLNKFDVGGDGQVTICSGDSGGSAFIQYADGSWHAYGIHSTKSSEDCDEAEGTVSLAAGAAQWIEETSGTDVTPCHDAVTKEWDPGPDCGRFLAGDGATGHGSWGNGCSGTPESDMSATCGPVYGSEEEDNPPVLAITAPEDYAEIEPETDVSIEIDATDDSGYVSFVQLEVNGQIQDLQDTWAPWGFHNVAFPEGEYELVAVGEDFWGNVGESPPIRIFVGMDAPDPPTDTGTDGGGTDGGDDGGTGSGGDDGGTGTGPDDDGGTGSDGTGETDGTDVAEGDGDGSGCGCVAAPSGGGAAWLVAVVAAGARRRRRT
jgi:MYXO-CTERM domain-containing protein